MKGIVIKRGKVVVQCVFDWAAIVNTAVAIITVRSCINGLEGKEVIEVCPEVAGGLPTPRTPVELVNGVATDRDGISRDTEFHRGSSLILKELAGEEIECAVLQSRSPSCGVKPDL